MAGMIFFTDNYQDRSTNDGYQFEFYCRRCGNGYTSSFQHSVTGFGGWLLRLGGDLVGGSVGEKAAQLGWDAEWMRDGSRGSTRDKAVDEMKPYFTQCHRCGQWVCGQVCWNGERGLCATCAPRLDREIAGMQAAAQVDQLNQKIQSQDWTRDINYRDQGTGLCPSCGQESGGGKSARAAAARWPRRSRQRSSAGTAVRPWPAAGSAASAGRRPGSRP